MTLKQSIMWELELTEEEAEELLAEINEEWGITE